VPQVLRLHNSFGAFGRDYQAANSPAALLLPQGFARSSKRFYPVFCIDRRTDSGAAFIRFIETIQ